MKGLSKKQRLWAEALVGPARGNATEAARRAGYRAPEAAASNNKRSAATMDYARALLALQGMGPEEVVARLSVIARGSAADFLKVTEDGNVQLDWARAEERAAMGLLRKVKFRADGGVEIELHDSLKALELMGRIHGLFKDRREISGPEGGPVQVEATKSLDLGSMSDEDLAQLRALLERNAPGG